METNSVRRSVLAFVLVGVLSPLAIVDCSSSNSGSGNPDGGVCPVSAPTSGSACFAADSTTCNYPGALTPSQSPGCVCCNGGGSPSYVCSKGAWQEIRYATGGGAPNNFQACPATMPKQGAACTPSCGGAQQQCSYDCDTGNGRAGSATCEGSAWRIMQLGLACPASTDGGPDASDGSDASSD